MKKKWMQIVTFVLLLGLFNINALAKEQTGASNTINQDGIEVTISTDKESYKSGEEVHYTITVNNNKLHWGSKKTTITYSNTKGLNPVEGTVLPTELPALAYGESITLEGKVVGDVNVFPPVEEESNLFIPIIIGAVALFAVVIVIICLKKKKGAKALALGFVLILLSETIPVQAADFETITVRPYVKFTYAGKEVMIRAVMDIQVEQELVKLDDSYTVKSRKITCHDPSIIKDEDGNYYIFGTHLAAGYCTDLMTWTSIDGEFRDSFSQELKDQIRAWNKDERSGTWYDFLWAPDVIYNEVMGKYCYYLSANGDDWKSNIVLLTADNVDGPFEYAGTIVYGGFNDETYGQTDAPMVTGEEKIPERYVTNGIDNRKWGDKWPNCIDPCIIYDEEGNLWMAYGSWSGGIFMLELDEETGLRDYNVSYETNDHSDPYFGKKIAGGCYVSGEGAYIERIGDYYYLFISYGNLEAAGGYNMRVFRSENPDGPYVDALGNSSFYDKYIFNYNHSVGYRLFGGYKWRSYNIGQVAQGHNSAFVDDDGKAYVVFHTRISNGTEAHNVKVHQLFVNKEGWIIAAPYATQGETLNEAGLSAKEVAGDYELIIHNLDIDYANLETMKPEFITLKEDGTITGAYAGSWALEAGTPYITVTIDGKEYSGVALNMCVEQTSYETVVFTALGIDNQITVWGSKTVSEDALKK